MSLLHELCPNVRIFTNCESGVFTNSKFYPILVEYRLSCSASLKGRGLVTFSAGIHARSAFYNYTLLDSTRTRACVQDSYKMDDDLSKRLEYLLQSASHYSMSCPQLATQLT